MSALLAADEPGGCNPPALEAPLNLPLPTLGGMQFWGDLAHHRGWRVQRHVVTGHHRLLDPHDVRRTWGSRAVCDAKLAAVRTDTGPVTGDTAVLIHGVLRSSKSWGPLRATLAEAGVTPVPFDYPSTRVPIERAAGFLDETLRSLECTGRVHLVCHSMGGLLVRQWTKQYGCDSPVLSEGGDGPKLGRTVLIGVPNRGAAMADRVDILPAFHWLFGPAGRQLGTGPAGVTATLPPPPGEFAIIAGVRGTPEGFNPLVDGDDDGTVALSETHLDGAADSITVPGAVHSFLMGRPEVGAATVRFLKEGRLTP